MKFIKGILDQIQRGKESQSPAQEGDAAPQKGPSSADSFAKVPAAEVISIFRKKMRTKEPVEGALFLRMGDLFRDMGDEGKALGYYEAGASVFADEEDFEAADIAIERFLRISGVLSPALSAVRLESALSRKEEGESLEMLDSLRKSVSPSDPELIRRVQRAVDLFSVGDAIDFRLAECFVTWGRREMAVQRLSDIRRRALERGDDAVASRAQSELASLGVEVGESSGSSAPFGGEREDAGAETSDDHWVEPVAEEDPVFLPPIVRPSLDADVRRIERGLVVSTEQPSGLPENEIVQELVRRLREGLAQAPEGMEAGKHYDLGIGLLGMGMFPEAAEELRLAFEDPAYRDSAIEGLAQALVESEQAPDAILLLDEALSGRSEERSLVGLLYWRGRAAEAAGDASAAQSFYQRAHALFPKYQDLARRVQG